ncbi:MAG: HNH endonuclease [Tissierellia bacterium]|nr:HNH endonuclease [Tissierellia bacterium]
MKDKDKLASRYKEARWRRLRQAILIRDNYQCQYFKRYGIYKTASIVHHIVPATEDETKFYDSNNLISLSVEAHEKLHDRKTNELTVEGQRLRDRTKNKLKG